MRAETFPTLTFAVLQTCLLLLGLFGFANPSPALPPEIDAVLDSRLKNRNLGPIYKPQMPRAGYINTTQEELSKTAKPLESYIHFVEPTDKDVSTFEVRGIKAKQWTELEKDDVHRIFQYIFLTAPGLIMRASSGVPIALVRTDGINRPVDMSTDLKQTDSMAASASSLSINFANEFFQTSRQCHGLVHELVHAADYYAQIARSQEWVDFAEPTISKIRINLNFLSAFEKRELAIHLSREGDWVSLYGCENLVEALAEYTSTYITDRERVLDSDFEKKFANRLLVPAPRDLDAALHFKLGYSAFNHQQFDEAIAEYSKCTAIDPTAAMPHVRLAVSLAKKAQYEKAMSECKSAEACFEKARIPFEDSEFNYLLESKSTIAYRRGDYAQSIAAMNKVLEYQPPSRDKFYQRVWAEEKLTQYAPAALDLYEWHCANAVNDYIHSGMSDWRSTMNLLDAEVTRFPGLGNPLARRARFLETRGDAANNSDKMDFYARALSDVLGTIGKPDRVQERAFLDCGRLCYKLGRVDQIQGYIDKMTDTDTDTTSDEKDVLRIVLADGQGDKEKAAELFRAFKDRILHGQKPKMEKPFDYVTSLPALLSLPSLPSLPLSHGYRSLNELFQFRPFINQPMELRD